MKTINLISLFIFSFMFIGCQNSGLPDFLLPTVGAIKARDVKTEYCTKSSSMIWRTGGPTLVSSDCKKGVDHAVNSYVKENKRSASDIDYVFNKCIEKPFKEPILFKLDHSYNLTKASLEDIQLNLTRSEQSCVYGVVSTIRYFVNKNQHSKNENKTESIQYAKKEIFDDSRFERTKKLELILPSVSRGESVLKS